MINTFLLNRYGDRLCFAGYLAWLEHSQQYKIPGFRYGKAFVDFCDSCGLSIFDRQLYETTHMEIASVLVHRYIDHTYEGNKPYLETTDSVNIF